MENVLEFLKHIDWEKAIIILLLVQNFVKGLRDALDTTPNTDDNAIERVATVFQKVVGYLVGFRPVKK